MDRKALVFRFDDLRVDLANAQIVKAGHQVSVEPKALRVLAYLLENSGRLVEKQELFKAVWKETYVSDNALTRTIALLRKALGDTADDAKYIETVPTRGYRFIGRIEPDTTGDLLGVSSGAAARSLGLAETRRKKRALAVIACVLALAAAVAFGARRWISRRGTPSVESMQINPLTDSGNVTRVAISPDGRYVAYAVSVAEQQSLWIRQVATRSEMQILQPDNVYFPGLTFSPDGNYIYFVRSDKNAPGFHYLYSVPVLGGESRKLLTNIDSAVTFSPDGRQFAFTRGLSNRSILELRIAYADGSGERLLTKFDNVNVVFQDGAAWSPDGRTIALAIRGPRNRWALDVVTVTDGRTRELYTHALGGIGRPVWLPGGSTLLVPVGSPIENRAQLWAFSYPDGKARRFTHDLTAYDWFIDLTRDGNTLATVESTVASNIWIAPLADTSKARQLTSGGSPLVEAIESGGNVVALSDRGELWRIQPDGRRTLFADVNNVDWVASCGRFVVFNSVQEGGPQFVRADADGSNVTQLVRTNTWLDPSCSPDGKYMFYVTLGPPKTIWRMPAEGGVARELGPTLGEGNISLLSVSPDNKLLAYSYEEHGPQPARRFAVMSVEGGPPVKVLPAPSGEFGLNWSPDAKRLLYLETRDGVTNLWAQPLDGGETKQLTAFTSGLICDFNWSSNYKQLLLARGQVRSDVILLSSFL